MLSQYDAWAVEASETVVGCMVLDLPNCLKVS